MAFPVDTDTDQDGEVISLDGNATGSADDGAGDTAANTPEDRGDVVDIGKLSKNELLAVVKDAPAEDHRPSGIPKARFDEVNEAKKAAHAALDAANAEIAALKEGKPAPKDDEVEQQPVQRVTNEELKALRKQYHDALLDGDAEKYEQLSEQIDTMVVQIAEQNIEARQASKVVHETMQQASSQVVEDYPYLDTKDGELALSLIIQTRDANIAKGMSPPAALIKAANDIAPRFLPVEAQTPTRDLPEEDTKPDTRTANALRRGADDSNRQPPALQAGIGTRITGARIDVEKLDDVQFKALSDAEKKRLRGD